MRIGILSTQQLRATAAYPHGCRLRRAAQPARARFSGSADAACRATTYRPYHGGGPPVGLVSRRMATELRRVPCQDNAATLMCPPFHDGAAYSAINVPGDEMERAGKAALCWPRGAVLC